MQNTITEKQSGKKMREKSNTEKKFKLLFPLLLSLFFVLILFSAPNPANAVTEREALEVLYDCNPPAKVKSTYYNVIQDAYNNAATGNTIQLLEYLFSENVLFNRDISTILRGGYNCAYDSNPGYTTIDGSLTISNGTVTVENLIITATANTYSISGTVSGAVVSGVTVTLTGTGSNTTTTDSGGNYNFSGAANGNYTITPSMTGYYFSPTSININVNNADITGQNFTASATVIVPARLQKTGQIISYYVGDDGALQKGVAWPSPRFTDNGNQTITDNLTGLMWTKVGNIMRTRDPNFDNDGTTGDGGVSWQHALDYVEKLNQESYLGYSDWRLPNVNEWVSLTLTCQDSPSNWLGTQGFIRVNDSHWLSTVYSAYTTKMWCGSISGGIRPADNISGNEMYVWPVRTEKSGIICLPKTGQIISRYTGDDGALQKGISWPDPRFTNNGDQTITDNLTGLVWAKDGNAPGPSTCSPGISKNWTLALDYVTCLNENNYLGYNDWRLPNINELRSLVKYNLDNISNWLNTWGFINTLHIYWSSTTINSGTSGYKSIIHMGDSTEGSVGYNNTNYVWPVRAGQ